MKKFLIIAGLLFVPSVAHGQAFSPWVDQVISRSQQGITFAASFPAPASCGSESVQSEIRNNQSLLREFVIPSLEREAQSQSLRERTVCVENDRRLLQMQIRAVQDAMNDAVAACRIGSTQMLRENYKFIFRAYISFMRGATDPTVQDDLLRYKYTFHDPDIFTAGASEPVLDAASTAPLCPYTTDYGVHSIAELPGAPGQIRSFGCDMDTLSTITIAPLDDEAGTLRNFMNLTQTLSKDLYESVSTSLFNIDTILARIRGTEPPTAKPGAKPPPPHAELTGCLKPQAPDFDTDSPADIDAVLLSYPDYFETYNLRDYNTGGYTYSPPPEQTLPRGMLHLPVIDYFLVQPAANIAARNFADKRVRSAEGRPLPDYLVNQFFDNYLEALFRGADVIANLTTIETDIERETAVFDMTDRDAIQRMQEAAAPLEKAVNSLIDVTEEFLPKQYTPELTFFLARSCVDGHCQRTLDAVAKRTFNPYCHPYVSGKYTEEDAAKKCFCDPSMQGKDPDFWKEYCADHTQNMSKYDSMQPTFIQVCKEPPNGSSSSASNACTQGCDIQPYVSGNCSGMGAITEPKRADGSIPICFTDDTSPWVGLTPYLILHEFTHAEQKCPLPPGSHPSAVSKAACCQLEYDAYLVQGNAMNADGLLPSQVNGKVMNPDIFAQIGANISCSGYGDCFQVNVSQPELAPEIIPSPADISRLNLPSSVQQAIDQLDPRALQLKEDVCEG
jgi:hypothetical protein